MTDNNNRTTTTGNYNVSQPYVVGILSPSTTLYIDEMPVAGGRDISPPSELHLRQRRNTSNNSFQITSVTVQGSRNNDLADDSADDLDETSHTDDLSSDFLDSARTDNDGYHSEDSPGALEDLSSPCGPIIFTQGMRDPNMNLSLGVTPTFAAQSMAAGGVTMMTSKSESPISAQVPIMNPLPDNWQRRFKVVKIVSSEPFKRGRWLCMDFKDPPANIRTSDSNGTSTPPIIQITGCEVDGLSVNEGGSVHSGEFAQVYEIPLNQAFNGQFVMGGQQHMYGIILPQSDHLQPVTLVQDMSLQTTTDRNFNNNLVNHHHHHHHHHNVLVDPQQFNHNNPNNAFQHRRVQTLVNHNNSNGLSNHHQSPPSSSVSANFNNNNYNSSQPAVPTINHVLNSSSGKNSPDMFARTNSEDYSRVMDNGPQQHVVVQQVRVDVDNSESFSSLANELTQAAGLPHWNPPSNFGSNGLSCSPPLQPMVVPPAKPLIVPPQNVAAVAPVPIAVAPPTAPTIAETNNSSQTAPEKIPPTEVGHEVDPSAGSAASTGGNTVAIDNKIEQAMDLVKSHLMFAVREEVEVLKEKITELLERISQLEHENDILRANASAETLKQLSNQSQKKNGAGGNTGKTQSVATIPPST